MQTERLLVPSPFAHLALVLGSRVKQPTEIYKIKALAIVASVDKL